MYNPVNVARPYNLALEPYNRSWLCFASSYWDNFVFEASVIGFT